jgi:Holliday junction resolvase YEN1
MDDDLTRLLHKLFDLLQVPHHQAPGEAEAECALLQRLGVVDAVWSDDGDCFMFGCQMLIKAHKQDGKRVNDHVRVYKAVEIRESLNFDADSVMWRASLQAALQAQGKGIVVPDTFPPWKALLGYKDPAVSTQEQAFNLRGLRGGWEKEVNLPKLRTEL